MQLNNNKFEILMNDLPQFGLNPKDWRIFKVNSKNFVLKNRHDDELCLLGKVDDEKSYFWKDLQWLNL